MLTFNMYNGTRRKSYFSVTCGRLIINVNDKARKKAVRLGKNS